MEVLQRTANRGSISTGSYEIDNSVKLETGNNEWLYRASPTAGDRRTFTFSFWIKRTELGAVNASGNAFVLGQGQHGRMYFGNDYFQFRFDDGHDVRDITTKHRDTSAWLHVVVAVDTNQSSSSDRVKIYFNGVQTTTIDHDGGSYPDIQDQSSGWFTTNYLTLGTAPFGGSYNVGDGDYDMSGYLAEFCAVDGQQLAPTDFGEFDSDSGIWKPIDVSGINFGSEGYYLDFADAADLGDDESGNGNDFTENNLAAADQATDTPTNNFCTLFPPPDAVTGTEPSIKEGGTTMFGGVSSSQNAFGTMGVRSGKWYFESTITDDGGVATSNHNFGVIDPEQITYVMTSGRDIGASPAGWACASNSLPRNNNAAASGANATGALNENEIMGVAIDMDNGKIWWHRQGTYTSISSTAGDPANGTTPAFSNLLTATDNFVIPAGGFYVNDGNQTRAMNFGGYAQAVFTAVGTYTDANGYGSFAYQPPTGYYSLCTKNLAEYGG